MKYYPEKNLRMQQDPPDISYYASPVTNATKQNRDSRVCIDYIRLNSVTKTLHFPIPIIKGLDPKITDMKNAPARFCELNNDVTKNMRKATCSVNIFSL